MRAILLVFLFGVAGCESMPTGEIAWQGLHAVDVAQTINGPANDPCYHEFDRVTQGLIGEKPSQEDVIVWGIGLSLAHYGISKLIEKSDAPSWTLAAWQAVSIGNTSMAIYNNHNIGVKPWGDNDHVKAGCPTGDCSDMCSGRRGTIVY